MADSYREIDAVFHQVDDAVRQAQFATDVGIALQIRRHHRADVNAPKADRRGDYQPPARRRALGLRGNFGFLDVGEDAAGTLQIAGADIGQRHRARGPLQEPRAETILQCRDHPRHVRWREAELAGGRRKALEVGDRDKGGHGVDAIHGLFHIPQ